MNKAVVILILFLTSINVIHAEDIAALIKKAESGDSWSQRGLGFCYMNGTGVKQDYKKSEEWLQKAANQGCAISMSGLGELYYWNYKSFGSKTKTLKKAVMWFTKAVEAKGKRHGAARFLSEMHLKGLGTRKDQVKAYGYALIASKWLPGGSITKKTLEASQKRISKSKKLKGEKFAEDFLKNYNN